MIRETEKICGTCRYHYKAGDGWVCVDDESGYCTAYTEYEDSCDCWEARNDRGRDCSGGRNGTND